ncbi:MAG: ParA family protein, partial [Bacteroidales bacterium]
MITTFFSEKGGSGKTTFNILLASYLAYIEGKNVLYIDTDSPNFHAEGVRLREIKLYQNPENAKLFRRYIISDSLKIYDIQKIKDIRSEDNFKKVKYALASLKEQQKYDHIIID